MVTRELAPAPHAGPGTRVYAVADVHGHADKLRAMHKAIARDLRRHPVAAPVLVHLGDLIDRGPDSAGTLGLLASGPPLAGVPTVNLMGNHEWMMLAALTRQTARAVGLWLDNGGGAALASWGIPADTPPGRWPGMMPPAHLAFLQTLAASHAEGSYVFVHAGVRPGIRMARQRLADLLWIRDEFLDWHGTMLPESPRLTIVHGHTPRPGPVVHPNRIGLDTGAGKGGPLTCAVLDAGPLRFITT